MRLQVLVAGCSKDEKESVSALLREILKGRPAHEAWSASVVKATGGWSVTLDGPDQRLRGATFLAPEHGLRDAIVAALQRAGFLGGGSPAAPAPATTSRGANTSQPAVVGEVRDRHSCSRCGKPFLVIYMASPDEPSEAAPVACPHCWHV